MCWSSASRMGSRTSSLFNYRRGEHRRNPSDRNIGPPTGAPVRSSRPGCKPDTSGPTDLSGRHGHPRYAPLLSPTRQCRNNYMAFSVLPRVEAAEISHAHLRIPADLRPQTCVTPARVQASPGPHLQAAAAPLYCGPMTNAGGRLRRWPVDEFKPIPDGRSTTLTETFDYSNTLPHCSKSSALPQG
jgi:hypothetical protein